MAAETEHQPSRVFLSYARADQPKVARLTAALEARSVAVWWDRALEGGSAFADVIEAELKRSDACIVAWSKASVASHWVRDEAGWARDHGRLVPVLLDRTEPPLGFRQIQGIDLAHWNGRPDAPEVDALMAALGRAAPAAPRPARRRLPVPLLAGLAALLVAGLAFLGWRQVGAPEAAAPDAAAPAAPAPTPAPAAAKSVAVLPFRALSAGADDGYFADGVTEEVMNALGTVPGLLVTARTSAFSFKGQDKPVPEIARALGVAHVVEGSVRRAGERLRVTARLVRAADGFQLWQSSYDRAAGDAFDVQTEIAGNVAEALGVALDDGARRQMAIRRIDNVEAFIAFQKGYELYLRAHADLPLYPTLVRANAEFDRALALAPATADAYLLRSDLAQHLLWAAAAQLAVPPELTPVNVAEQRRLVTRDLDLALRHSRTPGQRAQVDYVRAFVSDDWSGIGPKLKAVLALRECVQPIWLEEVLPYGSATATADFYERQQACDPLSTDAKHGVLTARLWMGDAKEALRLAADLGTRGEQSGWVRRAEVAGNLMLGRFDAARRLLEAEPDPDQRGHRWNLLRFYRATGDDEAAEKLEATLRREAPDDLQLGLAMAAWAGDRARAAAIAARLDATPVGDKNLLWVTMDCLCGAPFPIEATPNFRARLAEAGFAWPPQTFIKFPQKDW
jgi:adenylate cyclase